MAKAHIHKSSNPEINSLQLIIDTEKHKNIELQRRFDEYKTEKQAEIEALQYGARQLRERIEKVTIAFEVMFEFLKGGKK